MIGALVIRAVGDDVELLVDVLDGGRRRRPPALERRITGVFAGQPRELRGGSR